MEDKNDTLQHENDNGEEDDRHHYRAFSATAGIIFNRCFFNRCFYILGLVLLTLQLPFSLLLLARLSLEPQLLDPPVSSFRLFSVIIINLTPQVLVPFHCISTFLSLSTGCTVKPDLHLAWVVVCAFQIFVIVGVHAIGQAFLPSGASSTNEGDGMTVFHLAVFFVGLYETTIFWLRMFVRPVVSSAIYSERNVEEAETSTERAVVSVVFGGAWTTTAFRREVERWGGGGVRLTTVGLLMVVVGMTRAAVAVEWMTRNLSRVRLLRRRWEREQAPDSLRPDLSV